MKMAKFAVAALASCIALGASAELSVGYARVDITPPLGMQLSGYGSKPRQADGVLDRLYSVAVAFSDGTNKAVVVASDIISMRSVSRVYRAKISAATGMDKEAIFLCATHTHTGPSLLRLPYGEETDSLDKCADYDKSLCASLVSVVKLALADLAPAKLSIARGEAKDISFMRRYRMKNGTCTTNPGPGNPNIASPIGVPDEQVQLVRVDRDGKDSIAIVNFQCHPDTIGGTKISGDWPNVVRDTVELALPNVKCLFVNGAQGDTNHICTDLKRALLPPRDIRTHKHMGRVVAGAAIGLWDVCTPVEAGKVGYGIAKAHVETIRPTAEREAEARKVIALVRAGKKDEVKPVDGLSRRYVISRAEKTIMMTKVPARYEIPLSAVTIGKTLAFAGFPGEPFTEYGRVVKKRSPFAMTIPACLTNGSFGYMPDDAAMSESGYESFSTVFSKGLEKAMVEGHLGQLRKLAAAASAPASALSAAVFEKVKSVGDSVCAISESVEMTNGIAVVYFTLKPEAGCDIRCRIALPPPEKWSGEFWGEGNSSFGGTLPNVYELASGMGAATATTDLGTSRYIGEGWRKDVPPPVMRDYLWRATHLMTVYGKRIAKAFYGRDARRAYFRGGSCGGRQALSEAMFFPADYDGIISSIPSLLPAVTSAQFLNLYNQTHDETGRALFTREQLRVVADAPIEYMKDREPKPYAGKILVNPFLSERDIEGFLALAARKDPSLADPDLQRRLKNIFTGVSRNGRTVCHGMTPGAYFGFKYGRNFEDRGALMMTLRYRRVGFGKVATWEEFDEEVARSGSYLNTASIDLSAFRDRGGKLIVLCGLEDQTTPCPEVVAWYEMLSEKNGGYKNTGMFCRLFALPGNAHGGGKGRVSTGANYSIAHLDLLRKWVEEGKAPTSYAQRWKEENLVIPVPPYPLMAYLDDSGNWKKTRYPEGMVRHPDPMYMATSLMP